MCASRAVAVATFALLPPTLPAQTLLSLSVPRPPDPACQNALTAAFQATAAMPPDSLRILLVQVSPCHPELGRAVGFLMRAVSTSGTDEHVAVAFSFSQPLIDSAAFAAARDIGASGASSEVAKVFSLLTLFHYLDREVPPSYDSFTSQARGAMSCALGPDSDQSKSQIVGDYTPLPSNAASESRAVAVAIQQQTGASPALQSASYCVLESWRKASALPSNPHWSFTTASLSVDYVCGNRFILRNHHTLPIALQWQVGSLPRRTVLLPPSTAQGSGERMLDAGMLGNLLVFLDGDLIFTRSNAGSPCS